MLDGPGQLGWQTAQEPRLDAPEAALVRPIAVATCDFDHVLVRGDMQLPGPIALGHELVAEVTAVGGAVTAVHPGDVVVVPFQVSCGSCESCRRGLTSACKEVPWLSAYGLGALSGDWGGAVADVLAVPWADAMLVPLPPGIDPVGAAALSCNVPDAYRAVSSLATRPEASVLVTGGAFGNISHYAVALARALGATTVDYLSADAGQSAKAEKLGARALGGPDEIATEAYDITVDNSQDPDVLALAVRATAPAGLLTATTMYPAALTPVPLMDMFARCITFATGQPHARRVIGDVLPLLAEGRFDPAAVVTAVADWEEAPEAFASGSGKHVCTRR
jgi:alcohol dehydrogenase